MQPCTSYCPPTQVTARKLGNERISGAALGAEAFRAPGLAVAATPDGLVAVGVAAEPAALSGTCGSVRIAVAGSPLGTRRYRDDPGTEAAAGDCRISTTRCGAVIARSNAASTCHGGRRGRDRRCGGTVAGAVPQTSQ